MAINYIGAGTTPATTGTGTGSTSVSPNMPSNILRNDLLVLIVGTKNTTPTINTPTLWTLGASGSGGGGATGANIGPSQCYIFYKVYDGSESAPTVSITSGNSSWAQVLAFRSTTPGVWSVDGTSGTDTTAGTGWFVTGGANPGISPRDFLICGSTIPTDVTAGARWSNHGCTATGVTFYTGTEISEPSTSTGNNMGGCIWIQEAQRGTASAAPTFGANQTTATNSIGVTSLLRIRTTDPNYFYLSQASMDTDTSAWATVGANTTKTSDATHVRVGTNAMKLVNIAGGDYAKAHNNIKVDGLTAGTAYTFAFWCWPADIFPFYEIVINWYTSADGYISSDFYPEIPPMTTGQWNWCNLTAVAPATTSRVDLEMQLYPNAAGDEFWVDEIFFGPAVLLNPKDVPPPPRQAIPRSNFY